MLLGKWDSKGNQDMIFVLERVHYWRGQIYEQTLVTITAILANTLLGTVLSALPECFYLVAHNDTIHRCYHKLTNRHSKDAGFLVQVHKLAKH